MWMEVHIYSLKHKSQASNTWIKHNENIKRPMPKNSTEDLRSRREHCWSYVVSVFENIPKNLVVQGRVQLEHSIHIVQVGIEATY